MAFAAVAQKPRAGKVEASQASKKPSAAPSARKAPPAASPVPRAADPPITLKAPKAEKNQKFQKVIEKIKKSAAALKRHAPAAKKSAEYQAAAVAPENEKASMAQAKQVNVMDQAPTKKPEPSDFLSMLRAEIRKVMPKKTEDAKDFMKGGDKQQLKNAMTGNVGKQKNEATADLKASSGATPDASAVQGKEVTPIPDDQARQPDPAGAQEGMPDKRSEDDVSLQKGKQDASAAMADNNITTGQMQKANDPKFSAVATVKNEVDKNADAAPAQFRKEEKSVLSQAQRAADSDEKKNLAAMFGQKGSALAQVAKRQLTAKEKDEARRKKVADDIEAIYNKTKATVDKKLESIEQEVTALFDEGADRAVQHMKDYVETRFDKRYSGVIGKGRWLKDKLLPLPDEVKAWFDEAHEAFMNELDTVVVRVANLVELRLREAKEDISRGQKEIRRYVENLPDDLKDVGKAAEKDMESRFDEMRKVVDDKKNDLAQKLAQRYKEASEKGDAALKELKDKHKSLYEKLKEAIEEVIRILREFKNRILAMLKKAKDAVDIIVADPIGFLKNLLNAIKKGINQFVDNIWTHLKQGFMAWLFGSLGEAGIQVPKDFSLPSILMLVLQVLGLTYERIRAKAVKLIGERNVALIEAAGKLLYALITGGPAKLWEMIKEYLGNLKEMIINAIQDWVVTTIIKAAVLKLVSMFNPVGAILQAIITIYNTVMFFIERINQILDFVEAIVSSVYNIATGAIGAAANWIEKALARMIPIIIAFLARLLGISGITEKIKGIIQKIQSTVDKAIDKVIEKVVSGIGKLFGKGKESENKKENGAKGDVKKQASEALSKQIDGTKDKKQIQQVMKTVHDTFKAQGLKKLELKDTGKKDEFAVFAEASPLSELFKLIPKRRKVRMGVSLKVAGDDKPVSEGLGVRFGTHEFKDKDGTWKKESIPAPLRPVAGRSVMGGLITAPEKGSDEIKLVTWNTGDIDPRIQSNGSHAERQFTEWFESQSPAWRMRVVSIDAEINFSPCVYCSADLARMAGLAPRLSSATLTWQKHYNEGPLATTDASLATMRKWKVKPSTVSKEESQLEIQK